MRTGRAWLRGAAAVGIAILLLVGLEAAHRVTYAIRNAMVDHVVIPYTAAQDFGPVPPWMDGLRMLEPDENLSWRNRRNVRRRYLDVYSPVRFEADRARLLQRFLPRTPDYLRDNPTWAVALNSRGIRGRELAAEKPPGTFRIVCVGDSWTFGANVDQAAAYPQRLEALLRAAHLETSIEVVNLGVMGYSSYQGVALLERNGLALEPDVVVIGFGMNDALVGGWRDKDGRDPPRPDRSRIAALRQALGRLEIVKLAHYIRARASHEPWSIGDYMVRVASSVGTLDHAWVGGAASEVADYDALEPYTRVSPADYERNILAMVRMARDAGADVVLLYNSLWDTPHRDVLGHVSRAEGVPLVDSKALIDEARAGIEAELERRLNLRPTAPAPERASNAREIEVVFRVYTGERPVDRAIHVSGTHPALGDAEPNVVAMRDDGGGGDQRAGDGVWSHAALLPAGATVFYVYTDSGEPGVWEGMDIPDLRRIIVPADAAAGRLYRPIETFGAFYLQADGWHTNAAGYEMIASAVVDALRNQTRLGAHAGEREPVSARASAPARP